MKNICVCLALIALFSACATKEKPTGTVPLDQAIAEAARDIENNVQEGQKVAILNFTSPTEQFSAYVLDELSIQLANGKKLVVVDRRELDLIRQEEKFQMSGEVSDESAQSIGKKLGAQIVVSGSLNSMGNAYRFRIRALNVESAVVEAGSTADLSTGETKIAFMLSGAKPAPAQPAAPAPAGKTYKVGDTGPAGGIVFFDRGFVMDGWQYLEAAPARAEFTAQWGANGEDIAGTGTGVGTGKRNTERIVEHLNQSGETGKAAQVCAAMDMNGYKDWFLPSKDELDLMYKKLKQKRKGGFRNEWYWSSSQGGSNDNYAWGRLFDGGLQDLIYKLYLGSVRAVRAF
jgi:TolB-like protein